MPPQIPPTPRNKAIQYLAMREHSYLELFKKLKQKGYESAEIDAALGKLIDDKLLSDARFGEAFVRSRVLKGQGPVRIRMELREKGLNETQITYSFSVNSGINWDELLEHVFLKKYPPNSESEADAGFFGEVLGGVSVAQKAKQWRFLQYRGFSQTQIGDLFRRLASRQ